MKKRVRNPHCGIRSCGNADSIKITFYHLHSFEPIFYKIPRDRLEKEIFLKTHVIGRHV